MLLAELGQRFLERFSPSFIVLLVLEICMMGTFGIRQVFADKDVDEWNWSERRRPSSESWLNAVVVMDDRGR